MTRPIVLALVGLFAPAAAALLLAVAPALRRRGAPAAALTLLGSVTSFGAALLLLADRLHGGPAALALNARGDLAAQLANPARIPFNPAGTTDAKVVDTAMAKKMSFAARWGSADGVAFDAPKFLSDHPQFDWMAGILVSRVAQPWADFTAGEKK